MRQTKAANGSNKLKQQRFYIVETTEVLLFSIAKKLVDQQQSPSQKACMAGEEKSDCSPSHQ